MYRIEKTKNVPGSKHSPYNPVLIQKRADRLRALQNSRQSTVRPNRTPINYNHSIVYSRGNNQTRAFDPIVNVEDMDESFEEDNQDGSFSPTTSIGYNMSPNYEVSHFNDRSSPASHNNGQESPSYSYEANDDAQTVIQNSNYGDQTSGSTSNGDDDWIDLHFIGSSSNPDDHLDVQLTDPFIVIKSMYLMRHPETLRNQPKFNFMGAPIKDYDTPESLGMSSEENVVDVLSTILYSH